MMHKVRSLTGTIKQEADRMGLTLEQKSKALELFLEGYDRHKQAHGSYKHLTGVEYYAKMESRYNFMFNRSFNYIQEVAVK